ncbi:MAG: precorrin-6y C5,15-methyltransferase (decarboxylating) subunit CbiE [Polyangiaceae bacterium]
MSRADQPGTAEHAAWLSIVGIGADGVESLSRAAQRAIGSAELVVGSERQLGYVQSLVRGERMAWPSPMSPAIDKIFARRGRATCLLASGDPFFFGIGATLAPRLVRGEFICYPAPSSISLAASRLGWPLQDVDVVSLHGRRLDEFRRYLQPGRKVIALSWDRRTPAELAELLAARGFGGSTVHVLESLGAEGERIRTAAAAELRFGDVADLNLVAVELRAEQGVLVIPSCAGLPDRAFENDGRLTKLEVRAITLSALAPRPGLLLWDVGAGAGSIAIEWMLAHRTCSAIAIERDAERCGRIRNNAASLGVPGLEIIEAAAPNGLQGLATPDAIFIGGGASDPGTVDACWRALRSGGRLVVNSVSLETEEIVLKSYRAWGGELRRIAIETAVPLGAMTGWRPAMPIVQWRAVKP